MARLYVSISGLGYKVLLNNKAKMIPSPGDQIRVNVEYLDSFYRQLLEETPAYHGFERNEKTEQLSMAEYLDESIITVTERVWHYENDIDCCTLEVEVEF